MPWVLEEAFAAGGLDLHAEVTLRAPGPLLPDPLGRRGAPLRLRRRRRAAAGADRALLGRATPPALDGFLAALRPIYEEGILGAGPAARSATCARFAPLLPRMARLGAACRCTASSRATSSTRASARRSRSTRCSSAATRSACRRSTRALVYLQFLDGGWYARRRRVLARARRWRGRSTCAAASAWRRIEHARAARVRGVVLAGGERDRRRRRRLQRRRPAHARAARRRARRCAGCARRCRASCSTSGTDRRFERAAATTRCSSGDGYRRVHPRRHARRAAAVAPSRPTCTRPSRTEPAMAAGRRRLARASCCRCPNLRAGVDWAREADRLRDALRGRPRDDVRPGGAGATRSSSSTA